MQEVRARLLVTLSELLTRIGYDQNAFTANGAGFCSRKGRVK
jgi:hypothetical protein